jgi:hypothetical protein
MKAKLLGIIPWRKNADAAPAKDDMVSEAKAWFESAIEQGTSLELLLPGEGDQMAAIHGTPYQLRQSRVYMEIREHGVCLGDLKNREVIGFMGVRRDGKLSFCRFSSSLIEAGVTKLGFRMAILELPRSMEVLSRSTLRIEPVQSQSVSAELWAAKLLKSGQEGKFSEWGPADLVHSNEESQLRIMDMSASGMRLRLSPTVIRQKMMHGLSFQKGRRFFLRMSLWDGDRSWSAPLILFSVIRSAAVADQGQAVDLGLQFIGMASQGGEEELLWSRLPADGVPLLTDWVFQRHLEQARMQAQQDASD